MHISLTRYLVEQQRAKQNIPPELRLLLEVVARACKSISHAVNKGALGGVLGSAGSENVQGEVQKKLDVISNEVLIEANEWGGHLAAMASEEMDTISLVPDRYPQGEYLLLFDPLDGSSNIDVNVSIGTIFSVLRKVNNSRGVAEEDFLQPGKQQAAAGWENFRAAKARADELERSLASERQRADRLAAVAEVAVRVVLEHRDAVAGRDLGEAVGHASAAGDAVDEALGAFQDALGHALGAAHLPQDVHVYAAAAAGDRRDAAQRMAAATMRALRITRG